MSAEADFQKLITDYATLHGWTWAHHPDSRKAQSHTEMHDGSASTGGLPDLIMVHRQRGVFLALEVKAAKGSPSSEQFEWNQSLKRANIEAYIVYPSCWKWLAKYLCGECGRCPEQGRNAT